MHFVLLTLLFLGEATTSDSGPSRPFLAGLAPGMTRAEVVRRVGTPVSVVSHGRDDELGMGSIRELRYPGLSVWLCQASITRPPVAFRIEVSSPRWFVSGGLRIGHARHEVLRRLGTPTSSRTASPGHGEVLRYSSYRAFDGWLDVTLESDHVSHITYEDDWS